MDLSTNARVRIDCERCGRPYDLYSVVRGESDVPVLLLEPDQEFRVGRYAPRSGRHRARPVFDAAAGSKANAYAFECGCGHKRTIGLDALKRKLIRAPEPRIRL